MPNLSIELLKKPQGLQKLTSEFLKNEAAGLKMQWIARNGFETPPPWVENMFNDLGGGAFWGVFAALNGKARLNNAMSSVYRAWDEPGVTDGQRSATRELVRKTLTDTELAQIFELAIRTALTRPENSMSPGRYIGHDTLYTQIFGNPGSFLEVFATDEVKRMLNNGRFWEMLPDMKSFINGGYSAIRVKDVLMNHFGDLDIEYAPQGIALFEQVYNPLSLFELDAFKVEQADQYGRFIKSIDTNRRRLGIARERIAPFVAPYIAYIADTKPDEGDNWREPRCENYKDRLKDPWVREFVTGFDIVKKTLAKQLIQEGTNHYTGRIDVVIDILEVLPNALEIFELMCQHCPSNLDFRWLLRQAEGLERPLQKYFGPTAEKLLKEIQEIEEGQRQLKREARKRKSKKK